MRNIFVMTIAGVALAMTSQAQAVPPGCDSTAVPGSVLYGNTALCGLYTSVGGGYTFSAGKLSLINPKNDNNNEFFETHVNNGLAPMATSALGYDFYRNFQLPLRTEFTYSYQGKYTKSRNVSQFDPTTGQIINVSRDYEYQTQMLLWNTYYDWHVKAMEPFVPYVGLGAGIAQDHGRTYLPQEKLQRNNGVAPGGAQWGFAWDVAFGTDYFITQHWAVGGQWRLANLGKNYYATKGNRFNPSHAFESTSWLQRHTLTSDLLLQVRYEF